MAVILILGPGASRGIAQSPATISHSFDTSTIVVGETTSLAFKIMAPREVAGVGFNMPLPSGLIIASPNGVSPFVPQGACAGAVVTAVPGSASIILSGAMLAGTSPDDCTFSVNVTAVDAGPKNTAVTITSDDGPGGTSRASLTIDQASTTTRLDSPTAVSVFGESVTLTATVSVDPPAPALATGTVLFLEGSVELGTGILSRDGVATLSYSTWGAGEHSITAVYKGDGNFKSSSSLPLKRVVKQAMTTTVLTSPVRRSSFGESISLTATVRGPNGVPKGNVRFQKGADIIGIVALSSGGTAALTTSELYAGTHTVVAEYGGDINYAASTSSGMMLVVDKASTQTAIMTSVAQIAAGETVTLTARVSANGPTKGTVVFKNGPHDLGRSPISDDGVGALTVAALPSGNHSISALYEGDTNFSESFSTVITVLVRPAPVNGDNLRSAGLLILMILIVGLLFVLRRSLLRGIGRLFRALWGLLRRASRFFSIVRLFRRLGIMSRAPSRIKATVAAEAAVGVSLGALSRAFAGGTELDEAFHRTKFDKSQVHLHPHKQLFCSWINPLTPEEESAHQEREEERKKEEAEGEQVIQDPEDDEDEDLTTDQERDRDEAIADFESAKHFSRARVSLKSNPLNLWDDIEGGYIVELFNGRDNVCLYVLSEFRKTITTNVMMLVIFFSAVLSSVLVLNVLASTYFDFYDFFKITRDLPIVIDLKIYQLAITRDFFNKFIFGVVSCSVGSFFMWLFHYAEYRPFQSRNGDLMNAFLINYLAKINDTYKHDRNEATKTIIEGKDVARMQEDAVLWVTNTQGLALRTLFIELFLRSTLFQVRRNSGYYLLFVPLLTVLALFLTAYFFGIPQFNFLDINSDLYRQNSFYVFFLWMLVSAYQYFRGSLTVIWDSIEAQKWFTFRKLNLHNAVSKLLQTYVVHLWDWKGKFQPQIKV